MKAKETIIGIVFSLLAQYTYSLEVTEVVDVYDIDTFFINIPDIPPIFGERIPIRVNGIDGPEIRGKCDVEKYQAKLGRSYLEYKLKMAKTIELKNIKRGKYFRLIADVYVNGDLLAKDAIRLNLARPYHGGKRDSWCTVETK